MCLFCWNNFVFNHWTHQSSWLGNHCPGRFSTKSDDKCTRMGSLYVYHDFDMWHPNYSTCTFGKAIYYLIDCVVTCLRKQVGVCHSFCYIENSSSVSICSSVLTKFPFLFFCSQTNKGKEPIDLPELKPSTLLSLLLPGPLRNRSVWTTVLIIVGWRMLLRQR